MHNSILLCNNAPVVTELSLEADNPLSAYIPKYQGNVECRRYYIYVCIDDMHTLHLINGG